LLNMSGQDGGLALCQQALALAEELGDQLGQAMALMFIAYRLQGQDLPQALALGEQSLALHQSLGEAFPLAGALLLLGDLFLHQVRDYERSSALHRQSLALYRQLGDQWGIAHVLLSLAEVPRQQGEYAQAQALLEEALSLFQLLRDRPYTAW